MAAEQKRAGGAEVWAARAWNVFNEGRPFSLVFPVQVLLAAAPMGLGPGGPTALAGTAGLAAVLARFAYPLRTRALLWLAAAASIPLLEPWREPTLLAGGPAAYAAFTVLVWGSLYYHLRTGAPWTNWMRFWRLVLTNSDPTSGNALEQVPKLVMSLSAGVLLGEGGWVKGEGVLVVAAFVVVFGVVAWRLSPRPLPESPRFTPHSSPFARLSKRLYVIV